MFAVGNVNLICLSSHHHQINGNLFSLRFLRRKKKQPKNIFHSNDTEKYLSQVVAIKMCAGRSQRRGKNLLFFLADKKVNTKIK